MPFMSFELANWAYQQFLSSQKIMLPSMLGMAVGAAVHAIVVSVLYFGCDLGFTAICWATASVFVGRFLCTQCFIWFRKDLKWHDDVYMFSKETVSNLWPLIQVCLGSMFMGIWGWWAFEILTFMAQYLGETEAAAQSIMRSLGLLTFMLPVGYSSASGILTGNAMGAAKPNLAMTYYAVCMFAAMFITVLQMGILWLGRDAFIRMYTNQPDIAALMIYAWPVLLVFTLFDTTQAMAMSVVRASGKQGLGAFVTGTAYFIFGIPASWYFAFVLDLGLRGLWIGPTIAVAYNTICYNIIIACIDWKELVRGIKQRELDEQELRKKLAEEAE